MVNADPRRNYYEDLELNPSADANQVKKQYRQLGMRTFIVGKGLSSANPDRAIQQHSNIIRIETLGMKPNSSPSFKRFNPPTIFLQTLYYEPNMMQTVSGLDCSIPIQHQSLMCHQDLPTPTFLHLHADRRLLKNPIINPHPLEAADIQILEERREARGLIPLLKTTRQRRMTSRLGNR